MLLIYPKLQSMGIISEGFDLVMQHGNSQTSVLLVIHSNRGWRPLLLFRRNNLHLFRHSANSIYAQARGDRLVFHTCDISKLVGLDTSQCLIRPWRKEVDLLRDLDLWRLRLAWLVLKK